MPEGLSVVMPAFNEEEGIGAVLAQVRRVLQDLDGPSEIVVVDDGSEDRTAEVAAAVEGVRLVRHRVNRGYGAALLSGIRAARYDLVCITDSDATYPVGRIPDLAAQARAGVDMVVGARTGPQAQRHQLRRLAKAVIGALAEFVAGEPIPDFNSGMRVFSRRTALRFASLLPEGFSFTTTITLAMLTNGYRVEYVPVDCHPRVGWSKIRPLADTLGFLQLVLRISLYFAPMKIFTPLALLLLAAAGAWALFTKFVLGNLADVTTVVLAMTGLQVGVIGLLAELINRRLPNYFRED